VLIVYIYKNITLFFLYYKLKVYSSLEKVRVQKFRFSFGLELRWTSVVLEIGLGRDRPARAHYASCNGFGLGKPKKIWHVLPARNVKIVAQSGHIKGLFGWAVAVKKVAVGCELWKKLL
jgi:hypothetical protein